MITVEALYAKLGQQIANGNGKFPVAFGDCNDLRLISGASTGHVCDLNDYYLEEVHPDDREEDEIDNVFIVGE